MRKGGEKGSARASLRKRGWAKTYRMESVTAGDVKRAFQQRKEHIRRSWKEGVGCIPEDKICT